MKTFFNGKHRQDEDLLSSFGDRGSEAVPFAAVSFHDVKELRPSRRSRT